MFAKVRGRGARGGVEARELAPCHIEIVERLAPSVPRPPHPDRRIRPRPPRPRTKRAHSNGSLQATPGFTQDDGHVFCEEGQIEDEVARFCRSLRSLYAAFAGFLSSFSVAPFLDTAGTTSGKRRPLGQGRARPRQRREAPNSCAELQAGEGGLLRARQARSSRCGKSSGPFMAVRHDPARLRNARALSWSLVYRFAGRQGEAGDASPGDLRVRSNGLWRSCWSTTSDALPAWLAPEQVRVLPISDEQAPYARTDPRSRAAATGTACVFGTGKPDAVAEQSSTLMMPACPSSPLSASARQPHPKWPCASETAARAS